MAPLDEPKVSFGTSLMASMSGTTTQHYVALNEDMIANLDKLEEMAAQAKLSGIAEWDKVYGLYSALSSLQCYVYNNDKPAEVQRRVEAAESVMCKKIIGWWLKILRNQPPDVNLACRYLNAAYKLHTEGDVRQKLMTILYENHMLWSHPETPGKYLIGGMHLKLGDNTFTIDRRGREYRNYYTSIRPQAFLVQEKDLSLILPSWDVPKLPAHLEETWHDRDGGRHAGITPRMHQQEFRKVIAIRDSK